MKQMEDVANQHVEDEEHFHKIQLVDQNNLEKQLDSIQVSWANKLTTVLGAATLQSTK